MLKLASGPETRDTQAQNEACDRHNRQVGTDGQAGKEREDEGQEGATGRQGWGRQGKKGGKRE